MKLELNRNSKRLPAFLLVSFFTLLLSIIIIGSILIFSLVEFQDTNKLEISGVTQIGLLILAVLMIVYPTTLVYLLLQHFSTFNLIKSVSIQKNNNVMYSKINDNKD